MTNETQPGIPEKWRKLYEFITQEYFTAQFIGSANLEIEPIKELIEENARLEAENGRLKKELKELKSNLLELSSYLQYYTIFYDIRLKFSQFLLSNHSSYKFYQFFYRKLPYLLEESHKNP